MAEYIERETLIKAIEADYNSDWNSYARMAECLFNSNYDNYIEGVRDEYEDALKIIRQQKAVDLQSVNPWLKTSVNLDKLEDHYYYFVTHPDYKTPIKAKYHNDMGGYFEFPNYPVVAEFTDPIIGECKIKYFMELPEMPDDYEEVDSVD